MKTSLPTGALLFVLWSQDVIATPDKDNESHVRNLRSHGRSDGNSGSPAYHHFSSSGEKRGSRSTVRNNHFGTNIVGGDQSDVGEFPYYVDMGGCGGSLIAPDVVLSAAHCGGYKDDTVIVGGYKSGSTNNGAVKRTVVKQKKHPDYNGQTMENDFFLFKLDKPVTMSTSVTLDINSEKSIPSHGQTLSVMGLGLTTDGGSAPDKLRDVEVKAIRSSDCNAGNAYNGEVDDATMLCAAANGKDSCQGDSGGPIVIRNGNQHTQVGVVSWGYGCADPKYPGVYSRVSSAHSWIKSVVCDTWNTNADFCDGGSGGGGGGGTDPTPPPDDDEPDNGGCVDLVMDLKTDKYPWETSFFMVTDEDEFIWDEWKFQAKRDYRFEACLDPNGCATLDLFDSWGDGLISPGMVKLTWDGSVVYESGDYSWGEIFQFGNGCHW